MTASIKGMLAGLAAVALAGAAFAQGNPPSTSAKDPAVGAGQQSTKQTPMGTTGTPANSGSTMSSGKSSSSDTSASMGTSSSSNTGSSTASSGTDTSTTVASDNTSTSTKHKARADRN